MPGYRTRSRSPRALRLLLLLVCAMLLMPAVLGLPARTVSAHWRVGAMPSSPALPAATRPLGAPAATVVPLLGITPPVVVPGGRTLVTGSGFAPGEVVVIRINGTLSGSVSTDSFGNFGSFLITVPQGTPSGSYVISATGSTSGQSASASLTVQATQAAPTVGVTINPASTVPGSVVVVAGAGFLPGETVLVNFNGAPVQRVTADASGAFVNGSFFVPGNQPAGRYVVTVTGASSGRAGSSILTVNVVQQVPVARFFVSPSTVAPGARVGVGGSGFAPNETVVIRLGNSLLLAPIANAAGQFSGSFVASLGFGSYTITANGVSSSRGASAALRVVQPVLPGIGLLPSRAARGAAIGVNGNNFLPYEIVLIRFRGAVVQAVQADAAGRFTNARFPVPGNAPLGLSPVTITGARSGRTATSQLLVTASPQAGPRLGVSAGTVYRGGTVTLSGSGFQSREVVLLRFRGGIAAAIQTSGAGAFANVRFSIPLNSPYGQVQISGTGLTSGRSASVTLKVAPRNNLGISLSPGQVKRGRVAAVSGHGFAAGEIVLIRIDGILVQAPTADRAGNFANARFEVPRTIRKGTGLVDALGSRSGRHTQANLSII